MRRTALLAHLSFPAVVAVGAFALALRYETFGTTMFAAYVFGGALFYAAPHLLWAVIAVLGQFTGLVWHAGFFAASVALVFLLVVSLAFRDSSGLPIQWLAYWPLALIFQVVLAGAVALFCRRRPNVGV